MTMLSALHPFRSRSIKDRWIIFWLFSPPQALVCSCFIPVYCGLIPPAFRGVVSVNGHQGDVILNLLVAPADRAQELTFHSFIYTSVPDLIPGATVLPLCWRSESLGLIVPTWSQHHTILTPPPVFTGRFGWAFCAEHGLWVLIGL